MSNGFSDATKAGIAVLQRLGGVRVEPQVCPWCKVRPADEVDHITARANGGTNSVFNGMWICVVCNRRKSAQAVEDGLDYVKRTYNIVDVELWIGCGSKAEYDLLIGRKLRKRFGWRASEPPQELQPLETGSVRANPVNPINPVYVQEWKGGVWKVIPLW